jgi:hypothetical protein
MVVARVSVPVATEAAGQGVVVWRVPPVPPTLGSHVAVPTETVDPLMDSAAQAKLS